MSSGVFSSRSDYAVGQTLNTSLNLSASPFTDASQILFHNAFIKKKTRVDPNASGAANSSTESEDIEQLPFDNQGRCEMYCTLVQSEKVRTKALGVDGSLDMSYGPVSGDANLKFAMNNTQGSLQLTMVVRAKQEGRIIKNELPEIINLELRKAVTTKIQNGKIDDDGKKIPYTIDDFKKEYGSYLIYGFDYGGEINFTSTYSTNSSDDKMSVGGGLTVQYKEMGFNIKGSVQGNYSSDDVSRSTNIETKYTISPSFNSDLINGAGGIIQLLTKISDPTTNGVDTDDAGQTSAELYSKMQQLLGGNTLDPVKAIVYPIEKIGCISDAFSGIDLMEESKVTKFCKAMNPLYQTLKEILKAVVTIDKNYDINTKPTDAINLYLEALEININKMEMIHDEELDTYAKDWYDYTLKRNLTANNNGYEVQKNFYEMDKSILESEFNKDLFDPYNEMMKNPYNAESVYNISLKGHNGKYVGVESDGSLHCDKDQVQELEIFTSIPMNNDQVMLYSIDGSSVIDSDGHVKAVKAGIQTKDMGVFRVIACDNGTFGLQCVANDRYISCMAHDDGQMQSHTKLNETEQFKIRIVE